MKKQDCKNARFASNLHPKIREKQVKNAGIFSEYPRSKKIPLWIKYNLYTGSVDNMWTELWINQFNKNTQKRHHSTKNKANQNIVRYR